MIYSKERPNFSYLPQWCIMCRQEAESEDYLSLHCPLAGVLWQRLFQISGEMWVCLGSSTRMFEIGSVGFGRDKTGPILWSCTMMALFWVIWLERNARIFYEKEECVDGLWDRVYFLASFWASVSRAF